MLQKAHIQKIDLVHLSPTCPLYQGFEWQSKGVLRLSRWTDCSNAVYEALYFVKRGDLEGKFWIYCCGKSPQRDIVQTDSYAFKIILYALLHIELSLKIFKEFPSYFFIYKAEYKCICYFVILDLFVVVV